MSTDVSSDVITSSTATPRPKQRSRSDHSRKTSAGKSPKVSSALPRVSLNEASTSSFDHPVSSSIRASPVFSSRHNSYYKWHQGYTNMLGALEIPSEPNLAVRLEHRRRPLQGKESAFMECMAIWDRLQLQTTLIQACESRPVETCCCGTFTDHDQTIRKLVPYLNTGWVEKTNERLKKEYNRRKEVADIVQNRSSEGAETPKEEFLAPAQQPIPIVSSHSAKSHRSNKSAKSNRSTNTASRSVSASHVGAPVLGFYVDAFVWNWQNATGKAETNILLIRLFERLPELSTSDAQSTKSTSNHSRSTVSSKKKRSRKKQTSSGTTTTTAASINNTSPPQRATEKKQKPVAAPNSITDEEDDDTTKTD